MHLPVFCRYLSVFLLTKDWEEMAHAFSIAVASPRNLSRSTCIQAQRLAAYSFLFCRKGGREKYIMERIIVGCPVEPREFFAKHVMVVESCGVRAIED
jgi:hypothetical protein